jgi:hypothetical protein
MATKCVLLLAIIVGFFLLATLKPASAQEWDSADLKAEDRRANHPV